MIQVETAKVVLVGLSLAAVLTDDEARNRLQYFARPHYGTRLELGRGDGADAGGGGDPEQVLRRIQKVGDVPEGGPGGHHDVSCQRERQDDIHRQELAQGHGHLTVGAGEIDPPENQGGRSRGDSVDAPFPGVIGDGGELGAVGLEVDDDTGKDSPGLVDDGSHQDSGGLGGGNAGARQEEEEGQGGCSVGDDHTFRIANSLRRLRRFWSAGETKLGRAAVFIAVEI